MKWMSLRKEAMIFKKIKISLSLLLFTGMCASAGWANDWLEGANGYARGRDQSAASGKPVMVYFYTDWCPYCRKFEKHTLANAQVQKALSQFVLVRINPEKSSRENKLADQYRIGGFPSVFFENASNGQRTQEITKSVQSAKDFASAATEFSRASAAAAPKRENSIPTAVAAPVTPTALPRVVEEKDRIYLRNGKTVAGKILSENEKGLTLATSELGDVYFSRVEIKKTEKTQP